MAIDEFIGKKIGEWTVIAEHEQRSSSGCKLFICRCSCGNERNKTKAQAEKPDSLMCIRCHNKENVKKKIISKNEKYIGTKINKWTIIDRVKVDEKLYYLGQCECGKLKKGISFGAFKFIKSCIKCAPKGKNIEALKKNHTKKAEEKVGEIINVFKLLSISHKKNGSVFFNCLCLRCKKIKPMRYASLPFLESCGCIREKNKSRGSCHYRAKLTEVEVSAIREFYKTGLYSMTDLANQFENTISNISSIIKKKSWRHVKK